MGPSLVETATVGESSPVIYSINTGFNKDIFVGSRTTLTKEEIEAQKKQPPASYPNYLPHGITRSKKTPARSSGFSTAGPNVKLPIVQISSVGTI